MLRSQKTREHRRLQRAERDGGNDEWADVLPEAAFAAASDELMPVIGSQSSLIENT